jgi:hypothetical protein
LIIFQYIKCSNKDVCPYGRLEDTPQALHEWGQNSKLWITTIFYIFSVACFNCLGVSITKYASAAQRSTIDSSRTAIIWIFFISYQGPGHEDFIWLELIGFLFLIFGTFVYNEIIVLPFFDFNKYTKDALKAKANNSSEREPLKMNLANSDTSM